MTTISNQSKITNEVAQYTDKLKVNLALYMSIIFVCVFSVLTTIYYFISLKSFVVQGSYLVLCIFCLLIIHFTKKYRLVFLIYSITGVLATSFSLLYINDSVHYVDFLWMLAAISLAYFNIGKKLGTTLLVFSLIAIYIFIFFSLDNHLTTITKPTSFQKFSLSVEMILGFGINIYLFYLYIGINKYTTQKLKEANELLVEQNLKIRQQNNEKSILIKEVYHRVKNNLQIIISLLRIQSSKIRSEEVKEYFQESINQIMSISLIHQKLYRSESLSQIKFSEYATELVSTIIKTDAKKRDVKFSIYSKVNEIGFESLVPIGLIINELTLNSLKHAFGTSENGSVELKIKSDDRNKWIFMVYIDTGNWKANDKSEHSFGLTLIESLVEQLDGAYKIKKKIGETIFLFRLKNTYEPSLIL